MSQLVSITQTFCRIDQDIKHQQKVVFNRLKWCTNERFLSYSGGCNKVREGAAGKSGAGVKSGSLDDEQKDTQTCWGRYLNQTVGNTLLAIRRHMFK